MITKVNIFQAGIVETVNDPLGGIARELERQGDRVVEATQASLSIPASREILNPPPGPPHKRSGQLHDSVQRTDADVGDEGLIEVLVTAEATSPKGARYDLILRDPALSGRDPYEFITEAELERLGGDVSP